MLTTLAFPTWRPSGAGRHGDRSESLTPYLRRRVQSNQSNPHRVFAYRILPRQSLHKTFSFGALTKPPKICKYRCPWHQKRRRKHVSVTFPKGAGLSRSCGPSEIDEGVFLWMKDEVSYFMSDRKSLTQRTFAAIYTNQGFPRLPQ
jgi:hypothetical protein